MTIYIIQRGSAVYALPFDFKVASSSARISASILAPLEGSLPCSFAYRFGK